MYEAPCGIPSEELLLSQTTAEVARALDFADRNNKVGVPQ